MRPLLAVADGIDAVSRLIGRGVKWLAVLLVLVQFTVVVIRYAFGSSFIMMQESVVYIHASLFMLAIGYVYLLDAHVRVDFFYGRWSEKKKAWTDLLGVIITVLPFCWLLVWSSWGYVSMSFRLGEGPMAVGGLPLLPWLKSLIIIMAGLLAMQSASVIIRAAGVITGTTDVLFPARQAVSEG
ncbi:TRAP transporter small permease subunit [Sediminicoccus sp. KRV36]|uniref:TRAP transporter small permease subunit n=1 Tax=Sediminicoccus sp. KRV36 TaxID=3133721 RepID=UPI00200C3E2F|nr:TRAP transporter small permease subunit [Sediminicoccus rosea]UPY39000.1 TRAP transporter small permease subunit [Sediminicoccus rosea]